MEAKIGGNLLLRSQGVDLVIKSAVFVESAPAKLLSIGQFAQKGVMFHMNDNEMTGALDDQLILKARKMDSLYLLDGQAVKSDKYSVVHWDPQTIVHFTPILQLGKALFGFNLDFIQ